MEKLCLGCMKQKTQSPKCEYCGYDETVGNFPHQLPVGTLLQNQYLVGRVLGQGGFGITYIGWDQNLSQPVAIKEYFPGGIVQRHVNWGTEVFCANGETEHLFLKHRDRFLREARMLARFSDTKEIVQIKSFFSLNRTGYIVMEYVQGVTLKEYLKKLGRPMAEQEALAIMEPVLKALQKVHGHNLIHRDISPDNIMLPDAGGVKLIDFGTVRVVDETGASRSTEAVLKPGFAPMEQYNTRGNIGTWTDVYALCATLYYLLTGRVPPDVHLRLEEGEALTLLRSSGTVSASLIRVLEEGMSVRVAGRIQTVEELYGKLYGSREVPAPVPEKKKKIPGGILAAAAALIIVAAAGVLWFAGTDREAPEAAAAVPPAAVTEAPETRLPETQPETQPPTAATEPESEEWKENILMADPSHIFEDINGTSGVFGMGLRRNQIASVTVLDSLENAPEDARDVSADGSGRVLAWTDPSGSLYDLYIAGEGGVNAPGDTCYTLFDGYVNARSISFGGNLRTDEALNMENMFYACKNLTSVDLNTCNTENVTNMAGCFWKCSSLETLDLSGLNTANVTDMGGFFGDCSSLKDLDISGFDTGKVVCFGAMFSECSSLEALDLRHFDTSSAKEMYTMFWRCTNLKSVDVSTWDTGNVEDMDRMFKECPNLTDMRLGEWETDKVTDMQNFRDSWWEMFPQ